MSLIPASLGALGSSPALCVAQQPGWSPAFPGSDLLDSKFCILNSSEVRLLPPQSPVSFFTGRKSGVRLSPSDRSTLGDSNLCVGYFACSFSAFVWPPQISPCTNGARSRRSWVRTEKLFQDLKSRRTPFHY